MDDFRVTEDGFELIPREETEDYKLHQRVMEKLKNMTGKEFFQSVVDAGIYNEEGELTQRYGGSAPNAKKIGL